MLRLNGRNLKINSETYHLSQYAYLYNIDENVKAFWHSLLLNVIYLKLSIEDSEGLLENLKKLRIIDTEEGDKNIVKKLLINKPKPQYSLLRILITDLCNLNCKYCKVEKNINRERNAFISNDSIDEVLYLFREVGYSSPKLIQITGGEPLVVWKQVKYVIEKAYEILRDNFWIVLFTNGTLIDEDKANFLCKNNIKVVVSIDLSRHAHDKFRVDKKGRGTYQRAIDGYLRLKRKGCEVGVSAVVGPHNVNNLPEEVESFISKFQPSSLGLNILKEPSYFDRKLDHFLISPEEYAIKVYESFKRIRSKSDVFIEQLNRRLSPFILKKFKYYDCGVSGNNINIDSTGKIGPCKSFLILNKVYLNRPRDFFTNNVPFIQFMERLTLKNNRCLRCSAIGICGGGCAYKALIEKNDMFKFSEEECSYMNAFLRLFLEDLYKIVVKKNPRFRNEGYYVPTLEDRRLLWPYRTVKPYSLKYPIGHY